MKKIVCVTGSRAEYGILKRLLQELNNAPDIELSIVVTGMHCEEKYGLTYKSIELDGFKIDEKIAINVSNDTNADILNSMSICQTKFGHYFEKHKYDAVLILGDRYEIFSVAIAAAMHNLPIIHLHGGEKTLGNYDEFIRHSITKMSRLHLASTEEYRNRIIQMGEEPGTVFDIGALGAENALMMKLPSKDELFAKFKEISRDYFVVVFHPETLTNSMPDKQVDALLSALNLLKEKYNYIFIGSNSDTGSDLITKRIEVFCAENNSSLYKSVLPEEYLALCKYSCGLIGNSSSGLIEIPSLKKPTINIGDRQLGRVRGQSVIDCDCSENDIFKAILQSQTKDFSEIVNDAINPYYKTEVATQALEIIREFLYFQDRKLKNFYDVNFIKV